MHYKRRENVEMPGVLPYYHFECEFQRPIYYNFGLEAHGKSPSKYISKSHK